MFLWLFKLAHHRCSDKLTRLVVGRLEYMIKNKDIQQCTVKYSNEVRIILPNNFCIRTKSDSYQVVLSNDSTNVLQYLTPWTSQVYANRLFARITKLALSAQVHREREDMCRTVFEQNIMEE